MNNSINYTDEDATLRLVRDHRMVMKTREDAEELDGYVDVTPVEDDPAAQRAILAIQSALRIAPALVFAIGVSEGLMDPGFAAILGVPCIAWGLLHWSRG